MGFITDYEYYANGGNNPANLNWGSYQYVSMREIVSNFMTIYVGNDKEINNVKRYEVVFHAKQAIKEYNYNVFNEPKVLEMTIGDTLQMVLPQDYVNFIRISLEVNGVLFAMVENVQLNYANSYLQDNNNDIVFDVDGNVIETMSQLDIERLAGDTQQLYTGQGQFNGQYGWYCPNLNYGGDWYFTRQFGGRFGIDPETANINPTYKIDKKSGVINFSSDISGMNVVLEYITDGMENGNETNMFVPKLAEQAMYRYIKWALIDQKFGVQEYVKRRARKEYQIARDNAKFALSNMHPARMLMLLRKQQTWIK
jgi:hypothetical protein